MTHDELIEQLEAAAKRWKTATRYDERIQRTRFVTSKDCSDELRQIIAGELKSNSIADDFRALAERLEREANKKVPPLSRPFRRAKQQAAKAIFTILGQWEKLEGSND